MACFGLFSLIPAAIKCGLIDKPDRRKRHNGSIPLIGGIVIYGGIFIASFFFHLLHREWLFFLLASGILTFMGAMDDRFNLNFKIRLMAQAIAGLVLIYGSNIRLESFGDILGFGEIPLGILSVPITLFAIVSMVNAFNMIDGMNGVAGGIALIAISGILFLSLGVIDRDSLILMGAMIGILFAYLMFNLRFPFQGVPRIFLGDSGSTFLGFFITAFLIRFTQGANKLFEPSVALWVVAIPIMDIMGIFFYRLRNKKNPFIHDRTHIHHLLMRMGLTENQSLLMILALAGSMMSAGVIMHHYDIASFLIFILFFCLFLLYLYGRGIVRDAMRYFQRRFFLKKTQNMNSFISKKSFDRHKMPIWKQ